MSLALLGVRPGYVAKLSPGAAAEYNKVVDAYYAKGMKPDDVDRAMASYGPSFFEDKARATKGPSSRATIARAAGGTAVAAKHCGADGSLESWTYLLICALILMAILWMVQWAMSPRQGEPAEQSYPPPAPLSLEPSSPSARS